MHPPLSLPPARPCAIRPGGKRFFTFTVLARQEGFATRYRWGLGLDDGFWELDWECEVIAPTAAAAIDRVREDLHNLPLVSGHPINWHCAGPRGGVTYRFTGYESLIWAEMCRARPTSTQLALL